MPRVRATRLTAAADAGLLANRPAATGSDAYYFATDDGAGTLYQDTAVGVWVVVSGRAKLAYAENVTGTATTAIGTTAVDIPGVSITVPKCSTDVWLEWGTLAQQTTAGGGFGALNLVETTSGSVYRTNAVTPFPNPTAIGSSSSFFLIQRRMNLGPFASARSFKVQAAASRDAASAAVFQVFNAAYNPTYLKATTE